MNPTTGQTETLPVEASTIISEMLQLAAPLLGLDPSSCTLMINQRTLDLSSSVGTAGVNENDLLLVMPRLSSQSSSSTAARAAPVPRETGALDFSALLNGGGGGGGLSSAGGGGASGGGLDFSNLLGGIGATSSSSISGGGGGSNSLNLIPHGLTRQNSSAVQWQGMTLDDVFQNNTNPAHIVEVIRAQPAVWKELNYHNAELATKLGPDVDMDTAIATMRKHIMSNSQQSFLGNYEKRRTEQEMETRLAKNPYDVEANNYFGEKIAQANIDEQCKQMMAEYPETMGRVLMLYIDAEVNGKPCVAFVGSGAQNTIMSSAWAERLDILRLVDKRFEGTAVGVGSGKILGRIHIANLKISGQFFPCSITVMDSDKGLGDKNMDFLFGLDMLKRHRCNIDLTRNMLVLTVNGRPLETPFLHEHQLDVTKGGTRGLLSGEAAAEAEE